MELDNIGTSGLGNSHWGMRIMFNDYMTPHVMKDAIISTITLALLQDTG